MRDRSNCGRGPCPIHDLRFGYFARAVALRLRHGSSSPSASTSGWLRLKTLIGCCRSSASVSACILSLMKPTSQTDKAITDRISASDLRKAWSELSPLTLDASGNIYGTTAFGGYANSYDGANGGGVIFKITSSGSESVLYDFCSQVSCSDGLNPAAGGRRHSIVRWIPLRSYGMGILRR